jgi:hypothetical protein
LFAKDARPADVGNAMEKIRSFLSVPGLALGILVTVLACPMSVQAACTSSAREVRFADGSARMKAYNCSLGDAGLPVLQVEFTRLSEAVAGSLIEGTPYRDLQALYGRTTVLRNRVFAEAKRLFDTYGARSVSEDCYAMHLASADAGGSYAPNGGDVCKSDKRTLWYFNYPDREGQTAIGMPDNLRVKPRNGTWPAEWRFFYTPCEQADLTSCAMLWRPLRVDDLNDFPKGVTESELKLGAPLNDKDRSIANYNVQASRYLHMVGDMAKGELPDDFLILIDGDPLGCGCSAGAGWSGIHIRQLIMHTAFLKNVSAVPITIDGLTQGADAAELLRPFAESQVPASVSKDAVSPVTLAAGQTLAIPLRLNFVPSESIRSAFKDVAPAKATYEKIHNSPRQILALGSADCEGKAAVRRDSFGPPTTPSLRIYSYGPAVTLKGVSIAGVPIDFDRSLANFFEIAAGGGYGSCPYVYAFDEADSEWVRHGKIIDNASTPAKETTERRALPGLATRFRIAEEELELTFVRRVRLELTLADGRVLTLKPRNRLRPEASGHYEKIKYGGARNYVFDAPAALGRASVVKSTLVITGYYIRYADAGMFAGDGTQ